MYNLELSWYCKSKGMLLIHVVVFILMRCLVESENCQMFDINFNNEYMYRVHNHMTHPASSENWTLHCIFLCGCSIIFVFCLGKRCCFGLYTGKSSFFDNYRHTFWLYTCIGNYCLHGNLVVVYCFCIRHVGRTRRACTARRIRDSASVGPATKAPSVTSSTERCRSTTFKHCLKFLWIWHTLTYIM